ncbi:hypothetical protein DVR12_25320 [Chitinophaga silvatica]|uniref:Uncharacterized protein n=1 Tax=Chitinophaga silvatica TaxID=2282649 RepID=A0A3E1Y357_9BACT|nr:hypothetical protein [Chitinophaga silvatica]RFS19129.1 hypothetical protein DVR12_25320 [Chitinophaga silvatica]
MIKRLSIISLLYILGTLTSHAQSVLSSDSMAMKMAKAVQLQLHASDTQCYKIYTLYTRRNKQTDSLRAVGTNSAQPYAMIFINQAFYTDMKKILNPDQWLQYKNLENAKHQAAIKRLKEKGIEVQESYSAIPEY